MWISFMGERAQNIGNRLGNTVLIAPRAAGTVLNTATDAVDTLVALPKDALDVVKNTAHDIKNVFVESRTKGKWYQRVGNVILSPVVATGTAIEGAVRTAVTPVVNGVVNTRNTAKNTLTNARRSTFGRLFSKKPISDFSYDKLKTADVIDKNKNRFSRLQFGKKKGVWENTPTKKTAAAAATAAAATAATAATAAASSSKEVANLNTKIGNLTEENAKIQKQLSDVLASNKKLADENAELKKSMKELVESLKKDGKPVEKTAEKKGDGGKSEKKEEKSEGKGSDGKEIKDEKRVPEIIKSSKGKKMLDYLQKAHPEIKIETDSSTNTGHLYGTESGNKIVVGTKDKNEAPQILLHEISHVMEQDNVKGVKELKDTIKALNERYGKQLFTVSNNDKYDTKDKKTIEDVCEIIAMYARDDGSFQKHMEKLQSGENEKLAKINKSDAENLKNLCENIISNLH